MLKHRDYLQEALKRGAGRGNSASGTLEFYSALYEHQAKRFEAYRSLPLEGAWVRPLEMPVVDGARLSFTEAEGAALFEGLNLLLDVLSSFHPGMNFDRVRAAFAEGAGAVERTARALLTRDFDAISAYAGDYQIGVEEYIFILVNWFKPYFAALAEKYGPKIGQDDWMEPRCPVCGFYSDMARIAGTGDGRRFLHCALCEYEWHFKRIACPICDNGDAEKLGYFTVADERAYRVDYCDECRGYIKTVLPERLRISGPCDLAVENILTVEIDAAAMGKGYSRP